MVYFSFLVGCLMFSLKIKLVCRRAQTWLDYLASLLHCLNLNVDEQQTIFNVLEEYWMLQNVWTFLCFIVDISNSQVLNIKWF